MNIKDLPIEELIQRINDNIDSSMFPHSRISDINDSEYWDELGNYLEGYGLVRLLRKGIPERAKYFIYDSEINNGQLIFFTCKRDIIEHSKELIQEIEENY